jgi:hypothetical protein
MSGRWWHQAFGGRDHEYVGAKFEQGEMIVSCDIQAATACLTRLRPHQEDDTAHHQADERKADAVAP